MRIVFLVPLLGHPRYHLRTEALRAAGADCRVLAFERERQLAHDQWPAMEVLGRIEHGRYLARVPTYAGALRRIREAASEAEVLYCFGSDLLAMARLATAGLPRRPRLVLEVGDIRDVLVGDRLRAWAARWLERRFLSRLDQLVVTSPAYTQAFYHALQGLRDVPWRVVEPKVDPEALPRPAAPEWPPWDGVLRIVYYGWMCCARSWRALETLAREGGERVRIRLRGVPVSALAGLEGRIGHLPNVVYEGPFENPGQLPELFEGMDFAWIAHRDLLANHLWARATRFFNAGWFHRPMIAQRGTEDARVVEARELGPVIDLREPERAARELLEIRAEQVEHWRARLREAPASLFAYTDEHPALLRDFEALLEAPR